MSTGRKHNTDLYSAILMFMVAWIFWTNSARFSAHASMFPRAISGLLALTSIGLLVKSILRPEKDAMFRHEQRLDVLVFVVAIVSWAFLVRYVGIAVTSVTTYFLVATYLDKDRGSRSIVKHGLILLSVAVQVLGFILIFEHLLYVPLPHGFLY